MKTMHHLIIVVAMVTAATPALAFLQPNVNLGFTSFLDGGPPAGPGHYFQEYLQFYTADKLVDGPPNAGVDATVLMTQYIYQSEKNWGLNIMLPIVSLDVDAPLTDSGSGLGDLLIGPYYQWNPIMGEQGPLMLNRVELQFILPTGDYDDRKNLNPGSNHFSFNPYWAATVFLSPRATISWRLHYLWNGENDGFRAAPGGPPSPVDLKLEPGQAIHANFAFAYEVKPKQLRVGLNGYFFEQISDTKVNGTNVNDDESAFAIGPGAVYHFSQDTHLFFNTYFESNAENRPEGDRFNLRFVHHF